MSTPVLILGESGTGKSYSMQNLDSANALLIQAVRKPLYFIHKGWKRWDTETKSGNVFMTDKTSDILTLMQGTKRKIIILDDFQYILANELMRRWREKTYDKFSEIGFNGWNIFQVATTLPDDVRVYVLSHTMIDDDGIIRIKTPGKLLSAYTVEGLFSVVLRTVVRDGEYMFSTKNSGSDTVKSPPGMFEADMIPNDLALVDKAIVNMGW